MPAKRELPADLAERVAQGMSVADLARHYDGWSRHMLRQSMKRDTPELLRQAVAHGIEAKRLVGRINAEKANAKRALNRAAKKRQEPLLGDLSREKPVSRVTQAMRHLQRIRLGPCYPWKGGYYWMGKCLDEAALMAEATKRGWVI